MSPKPSTASGTERILRTYLFNDDNDQEPESMTKREDTLFSVLFSAVSLNSNTFLSLASEVFTSLVDPVMAKIPSSSEIL